ncbi:MAG: carbon monoxide dehydrogenase subunit G [Gammaproteobacteria bacterium]|nr:carbon monoxide dehydrogenase subunit G [Gammaproteobacteria bacterium]
MDINGEFRIPRDREKVWAALNDPDVLAECIPGCDAIERISDTEFAARITAKFGPVKSKFETTVTLSDLNPPESYTLVGEGKGGVAGFARGSADVKLDADGDETVLTYSARIQPGGKLAQVGSRLIGGTARKLSEDFFTKFVEVVSA